MGCLVLPTAQSCSVLMDWCSLSPSLSCVSRALADRHCQEVTQLLALQFFSCCKQPLVLSPAPKGISIPSHCCWSITHCQHPLTKVQSSASGLAQCFPCGLVGASSPLPPLRQQLRVTHGALSPLLRVIGLISAHPGLLWSVPTGQGDIPVHSWSVSGGPADGYL